MFAEAEFSLFDFACGISQAVDLLSAELNDHHKRVAYFAYSLAKEMRLPDEERMDIVLAAMLHDIGAFTSAERSRIVSARFNDSGADQHQRAGYKLLRDFAPFANAAALIRCHHAHFDKSEVNVPLGSYIIHLADRTGVLLDTRREILSQIPEIMDAVEKHAHIFHPAALTALRRLAEKESFWLDAWLLPPVLPERMRFAKKIVELETLKGLAKVLSQIIDFRSAFTATHSSGVAAIAYELSRLAGFCEHECMLMEMAGYLHDIGKLAVSSDILEKKGALDPAEYNEVRKHTYYTYAILRKIRGFEHVALWAACHHERLDGKGYPFHVTGESFSRLARIMSVADIFVAITEDRPYRAGMSCEEAMAILSTMADNGGIDANIVALVRENFAHVNEMRIRAQERARQEYTAFYGL